MGLVTSVLTGHFRSEFSVIARSNSSDFVQLSLVNDHWVNLKSIKMDHLLDDPDAGPFTRPLESFHVKQELSRYGHAPSTLLRTLGHSRHSLKSLAITISTPTTTDLQLLYDMAPQLQCLELKFATNAPHGDLSVDLLSKLVQIKTLTLDLSIFLPLSHDPIITALTELNTLQSLTLLDIASPALSRSISLDDVKELVTRAASLHFVDLKYARGLGRKEDWKKLEAFSKQKGIKLISPRHLYK